MASISNTTYQNTVSQLSSGLKGMLNNSYYLYNNYSPTIVTYYAINREYTTLDYAMKSSYAVIGEKSPIRYNKINQFILYGIEKIQINLDNGDQGLESQDITGDCYYLPNTIVPSAGDFFVIDQLQEKFLFIVESVNKDTMDTDSNFYKGTYRLEQFKEDEIQDQVVKEYTLYLDSNTSSSSLIEQEAYIAMQDLDKICIYLEESFMSLFYNERVQTFTYRFGNIGRLMYDEYMIEFIIRNKIMSNMKKYIYVDHKTQLPSVFPLDYRNTIFYDLEENNINIDHINVNANYIDDPTSIFQLRYEDYFSINHKITHMDMHKDPRDKIVFKIIPEYILDMIINNKSIDDYDIETKDGYSNLVFGSIISNYLNSGTISENSINNIKNIDLFFTTYHFYLIPMVVYCIKQYIQNLRD